MSVSLPGREPCLSGIALAPRECGIMKFDLSLRQTNTKEPHNKAWVFLTECIQGEKETKRTVYPESEYLLFPPSSTPMLIRRHVEELSLVEDRGHAKNGCDDLNQSMEDPREWCRIGFCICSSGTCFIQAASSAVARKLVQA